MMSATSKHIGRRDFLRAGLAGAAVAGLGLRSAPAAMEGSATKPKKIPVGLQLYSVRQQAAKDLPGVLEAVSKMGYQGVEFAGYYGFDAKALKKLLDDNGLACCGTHTGLNTVMGDALKGTIEFNQTIGNKYLVVPGMPAERLATKEACIETAKMFNEMAEKAKPEGMLVGYHAHGGDFEKVNGQTRWDCFFSNTRSDVIMQLDVGNCLGGGGDPYAILKKFADQAVTIHLKEHGGPKEAVVGEGEVNWEKIFALVNRKATDWYIVEHERGGPDPLGDVNRCMKNLRKMGI